MTSVGSEFSAPHTRYIALRVPDVAEARAELEAKGVEFDGETRETPRLPHGVLHAIPDGNALMLHRRYDATPA